MKNILFIFLFLNASAALLYAQKTEDRSEGEIVVNRYEKVHIPLPAGYSAESLLPVIYKRYDCFRNPDISLRKETEKSSPGGNHIQYRQFYRDIPVYGSGIKANIHKNGYILSFLNHLENPVVSGIPEFSLSEAFVQNEIHRKAGAYESSSEAVLFFHQGRWVPAYVVITFAHTFPVSFEWIADARTGEILSQKDRASYHAHAALTGDTTGRGVVFRPDPLTKAQVSYGAPYLDNSDQSSAAFNAVMDTVLLRDITFNTGDGRFYLEGPYVKIEDIDPYDSVPVSSLSGNFFYTRNRSGFEDVMVYYHIDSLQRYIQSLGFSNLYNEPLRADPHGYGNQDNSHFIPNGSMSYIGWGQGGVDDAEDADVITHEYGHALSYSGSTNTNTGTERKGLDEGIGDYICSSYSYDINPFHWYEVFTWDGHNEYWTGRVSNSTQTYPLTGGIYAYGTVWASCIMEIRLAIGAEASDKDFYQELYMNASGMTLKDAAHNFLDADSMLHNGANTISIVNYFCTRGLFSGSECVVGIEDVTPLSNWNLFPNPITNRTAFIDFPDTGKEAMLEVTDLTGKNVLSVKVNPREIVSLPLQPGLYFMRLNNGTKNPEWKKIWIE
ncbi:MAG: T9SS type A sorting domain-containing protein [Bacteroidia bacterium]|nr:T9SS type A sorting domain-containing protein [Bacteroidia bacterium]